ncbi:MAG: hypothetical protein J5871_00825 [Bacteroidales bacterium]|nr:hypothetical protein [Bacteroidales bacterium]
MKYICTLALLFCAWLPLSAQQRQTPEAHEKQLAETIENEVVRLTGLLKLEDWQVFYADSILNNNFRGADEELKRLNDAKVTNYDLYQEVSDKWTEKTYMALRKVLTETQWVKYNKSGAGSEKKARDRRQAKKTNKQDETGRH